MFQKKIVRCGDEKLQLTERLTRLKKKIEGFFFSEGGVSMIFVRF